MNNILNKEDLNTLVSIFAKISQAANGESNIKLAKIRQVTSPERATGKSAGLDFYVPDSITIKEIVALNAKANLVNDLDYAVLATKDGQVIKILVHNSVLIPSGVKVRMPHGKSLLFPNRSGIASKKKLINGAQLVDEDYTGEIFFNLINASRAKNPPVIKPGEKLMQGVVINTNPLTVEQVDEADLYVDFESDRGDGSLGSSDK